MKHCQYRPTITTTTDLSHLRNQNSHQMHKRAEQISHLHHEFEELKQKIKEVQTKNEKIIEKIHRAYNFKKKNVYPEQKIREVSPIIHYQKKHYANSFGAAMSVDGLCNREDYQYELKNQKKVSTPKKKQKRQQKLNNGEEKQIIQERSGMKNELQNYEKQKKMELPLHSQSHYNLLYLEKKVTTLDEALNNEKYKVQELEDELNGKGIEVTKLKNIQIKFKNYSKTVKHLIENSMEEFMVTIIQKNFLLFERGMKKNEGKLKNMKNLVRMLKDKQEEKRSSRLIEEGRRRRSNSRSRRESPKTQNKELNKSRSKLNEQYEKNKQFQQIANRYEEIIRNKTMEIERWDKKYKTKERQCHELKVRTEILQKKIADEDKKYSNDFQDNTKLVHKFSVDSNLLDDQEFTRMELQMKEKENKILHLNQKIEELQKKIKANSKEYKENVKKSKEKMVEDYDMKMKQYEGNLSEKNKDILSLRNKLAELEKKNLQKDCDYHAVENKLKKVEVLLETKHKKIEELEQLLIKEETHQQSIEKSIGLDGSSNSTQIKNMKEYLHKMEEELDSTKSENFTLMKNHTFYSKRVEELQEINATLTKEVQVLQIQNQQFKINTSINNISALEEQDNLLNFNEEKEDQNYIIQQLEKAKNDLEEKYQILKATHLKKQSEYIKQNGELEYTKKVLESLEQKYEKIKEEHDKYKEKGEELEKALFQNRKELEYEKEENQAKINQIERQWVEFEEEMKEGRNNDVSDLKSEKSSRFNYKQKYDGLSTQNEYLTVRLKEVQTQLQLQKNIEEKILNEYKMNTEKSKLEYKAKIDENEGLKEENQLLKKKVNNLSLRISSEERKGERSEGNNEIFEKIESLENELRETRQINSRLTEMEGQLFKEMKLNEEEKVQLMEQIQNNRTRIKELQQLMEMKESGNSGNPHQSHISASSNKRESIKSQSSLKYSTNSQLLMSASHLNNRKYRGSGIDFELSEAGSSFFEPSVFSNVEEIFDKEELPYERMKIKRKEQIKLLQKTSSYIKSLKKAIDEKTKKIKILEKKIQSLKTSELVRKDLRPQNEEEEESENHFEEVFRDYESVQLEKRKGSYHRKYRQLEDDTKLIVQENRLLNQQIEGLEEQLLKAEEQENSLVKIKDLYKDQIKKLMKKNDEQARQFEEELNAEKGKVQMSDSFHTMETIKQLLFKIVNICCMKFTEDHSGTKKKDEKKKQLEDCVNIISNVLKLDKKAKEGLLAMMHK